MKKWTWANESEPKQDLVHTYSAERGGATHYLFLFHWFPNPLGWAETRTSCWLFPNFLQYKLIQARCLIEISLTHSFPSFPVIRSMLTADWPHCLPDGTERHISTQFKRYWQVSRTDGHSADKLVREWLLVKRLAKRGLHQPINHGYLASTGCCCGSA